MRSAVYPERSRRGYTLIELLVVMSIIALLSVVGFVNFKDFSANQVAVKAAGEVQSVLRLAQSNATSSTLCSDQGSTSWVLDFTNATTIKLRCNPNNFLHKTYTLENAEISSITGSSDVCQGVNTLTYTAGAGILTFSDSNSNCTNTSNSLTITVRNKNNTTLTKNITIYKGGRINVQ